MSGQGGGPTLEVKTISALRSTANKYGFRGVVFIQKNGKFRARIGSVRTGRRWLGRYYDTAEEAAVAYDKAAITMYGNAACLNFPIAGQRGVLRSQRDEGLCPYGHRLADNPYLNQGRVDCGTCRELHEQRMADYGFEKQPKWRPITRAPPPPDTAER